MPFLSEREAAQGCPAPASLRSSLREWLETVSPGLGRVAAFDTRIDKGWIPGSAARGLWIKSAMLVALRAERPDVTEIETGNSTASQHMLAINQRLGFRPWQELNSWQGDVPELSARLG